MYAIFESGSHQYTVREGDLITIDRQDGDPGTEIVFDRVFLVAGTDGPASIGTPTVSGAQVVGTIVRTFRDKKIIIQKFRRRKNMRRRRGHRQPFTTVKISRLVTA